MKRRTASKMPFDWPVCVLRTNWRSIVSLFIGLLYFAQFIDAGNGRYHLYLLLVCGSGLMGVVVENVNIGFVLPYARCDLQFTANEQGALNAVGYIGIVVSSHFWGFLADTWGRRKVLRTALLGSFAFAVLSALSVSIMMLIVTRLLVGIWWANG